MLKYIWNYKSEVFYVNFQLIFVIQKSIKKILWISWLINNNFNVNQKHNSL